MVGSLSAVALYNSLDVIRPKREEVVIKDSRLQDNIDYWKENIQKLEEPEDLFKDYRLLEITLSAYGLETEINKIGLIKGVLFSDDDEINSLVNKMNDPRYREMHADLRLDLGLTITQLQSTALKFEEKMVDIAVDKDLDLQSPGIRRAIHFKRVADEGDLKGPFDLLRDPNVRDVLFAARGLPQEILRADIDTQGRTMERLFDIEKFDDEKYVDRIIHQYLVQMDLQNAGAQGTASLAASLLSNTTSGIGSGINLSVLL